MKCYRLVIGPDKKIKLMLVYSMSTGRSFDEVLRVLDSIQLTAFPQSCNSGELEARRRCDHPAVCIGGGCQTEVSGGWKSPKPYIRIVPQPN
jgi:thioredoxin-dependent peroxiredoxin